jgi:broad specificity phosphatase PhoE
MIIKLIRHGRSVGNEDGRHYITTSDHDIKLSEEGINQAKSLAIDPEMFESHRGEYSHIDIYSSPFTRTIETLLYCFSELENTPRFKIDHRLREQSWGRPNSIEHHDELLSIHFNDRYYGKTAISENGAMVLDRVHSFIDKIQMNGNNCLIFTHGVVINAFKTIINGYTIESFENMGYVRNSSITTLII